MVDLPWWVFWPLVLGMMAGGIATLIQTGCRLAVSGCTL